LSHQTKHDGPNSCAFSISDKETNILAITRRLLLKNVALAAAAPTLGILTGNTMIDMGYAQTATGEAVWRHAMSLFGDVK
jgi:hypothetical protein